jgi:opacity protein-like surface antigen
MSKEFPLWAIVVALALSLPTSVQAQLRIGFAGGPTFPVGDLAEEAGTGMHVRGGLDVPGARLPLGVRADIVWQSLPATQTGSFTQFGGLLNATWRLPVSRGGSYLVSGLGAVRHDEPGDGASATRFAWAAGAGVNVELGGAAAFVEARYLDWGRGDRGVPLTLGLTF